LNPESLMKIRGKLDRTGLAPARSKKWCDFVIDNSRSEAVKGKFRRLNHKQRINVFLLFGKNHLNAIKEKEQFRKQVEPNARKRTLLIFFALLRSAAIFSFY